jgi:hypothetical protein
MKQVVAILSVLILLGCFFTMTNIIIVPIATPNKISNPDSSEDTDPEKESRRSSGGFSTCRLNRHC